MSGPHGSRYEGRVLGWYGIFQLNIQASLKSEGSGDGKYDLADKEVEGSRVWAFGILVSMLDVMSSLSTMKAPSECSKGVGDEGGHSNTCGNLEMANGELQLASCCNHQQVGEPEIVSPQSCGKPRSPGDPCTCQPACELGLRYS